MATADRDGEQARVRKAREASQQLPAGLEDGGRDEALEHPKEVHPSGARADHRHSAPGTSIPGAPRPAAEGEGPEPNDGER
jgi:hypothetical protein